MIRLPAEIKPDAVVALVDSREQRPLDLAPLQTEVTGLPTGDYTVRGLETEVAVERKSLPDLLGCIGRDRARFERELERLRAFPTRCIVIESTWPEIEAGRWQSKVRPAAVTGSILSWTSRGIPVLLAENHEKAGRMVSQLLYLAARRRWRELRAMANGMEMLK